LIITLRRHEVGFWNKHCSFAAMMQAAFSLANVTLEVHLKRTLLSLSAVAMTMSCATSSTSTTSTAQTPAAAPAPVINPLSAAWQGPHGGWPAFDQVKVADFKPALEAAMKAQLAEIDAIANNKDAPTFDNTIVAMERAGAELDRVAAVYSVWCSSMLSDDMEAVQTDMDPKLAAFSDSITQNPALFARIEAVYNAREASKLTPEQQRLSWVVWNNFVLAGAKLDAAAKTKVADINQRLATLFAKFGQNLQADEDTAIFLKEADLEGMPQAFKNGAAEAAKELKHDGEFAITNTRSSMEPFLSTSPRRDLREQVWKKYYSRGDGGDANDNNALITEILQLRAQRAKLLGFATHAHWRLADKMAKTPETAMDLMMQVWPAATARVAQEVKDMQAIADAEMKAAKKPAIKIEGWDYRYYAEKVRKAKYDLDANDVKPYLELNKVREAMFWQAGQVYGLSFALVKDAPVFHADMSVYDVKNAAGEHVAYWYFDPFARKGKNSGAWEMAYRSQDKLDGGHSVLVSNNSNFVKGKPGEPVFLSWDDTNTMFHEFGHALHEMSSNVTYPSLAGTNTATDFVEFPSQVNENWVATPEILNQFLTNQKGEPMPPALVEKIKKSATFNTGFEVTEFLAAALVDMKLHLAGETKIDPDAFEKDTLKALGMPDTIVMRHRTPQFRHVFGGDGYSAGYYSYLWSEVLAHDAYAAFTEAGGPYDKVVSKRFVDTIMSVGNTVDPADAFRNHRGRDPSINAYLNAKGFPVPKATKKKK
jgi:peptidyl-dipeptidase Dcp